MRFGRNVASYKFALARALLELGARQETFVRMEDLAVPFAAAVCEHLGTEDRQSTSARSRFLDACRARNRAELDHSGLIDATVRLGFENVIDAFHVGRGGQPTGHRFFVDERNTRQGITLTDEVVQLATGQQAAVLPREVEARWDLVEAAWGLRLGTRIVSFQMEPDKDAVDLYAPRQLHRTPVTGVRAALSGYQNGRCAYCDSEFTDIGTGRVAVDHVLPFVLMDGWKDGDLHQVWNFVLACYACNSAKRDRPPAAAWMPWLAARTEHLIASHHPLRETMIKQLGPDPRRRRETRQASHRGNAAHTPVAAPEYSGHVSAGEPRYEGGDRDQARNWWQQAVDTGHPDHAPAAMVNFAILEGQDEDRDQGRNWWQQALATGHPDHAPKAMVELGVLEGQDGDASKARNWWQQALATGHPDHAPAAMVNLGVLEGQDADASKARNWWQQALATGHPDHAPAAMVNLGILEGRDGNRDQGRNWYQQALATGHPEVTSRAQQELRALARHEKDQQQGERFGRYRYLAYADPALMKRDDQSPKTSGRTAADHAPQPDTDMSADDDAD